MTRPFLLISEIPRLFFFSNFLGLNCCNLLKEVS